MAIKKGLGRGLGALFTDAEEEYDNAANVSNIKSSDAQSVDAATAIEIPIDLIDPNINQPRKRFDETAMSELVNSIRIHGVISPIIVVKSGARYMIIAGERRFRASKSAGLKTIPAIVRDYTPQQIEEISLIENLQREDLNPIETANAIRQLMDEYKYTQEGVADRIGKSRNALLFFIIKKPFGSKFLLALFQHQKNFARSRLFHLFTNNLIRSPLRVHRNAPPNPKQHPVFGLKGKIAELILKHHRRNCGIRIFKRKIEMPRTRRAAIGKFSLHIHRGKTLFQSEADEFCKIGNRKFLIEIHCVKYNTSGE